MKKYPWPLIVVLVLSLSFATLAGAVSETYSVAEHGFNGTLTVHSDGRLELSMKDGSRFILGLNASVDPQAIKKSDQLSLRRDLKGRIIFASDSQGSLIYTFRYSRDNSNVTMTDPQAMVSIFRFDRATGKVQEVLLPSGKKLRFP